MPLVWWIPRFSSTSDCIIKNKFLGENSADSCADDVWGRVGPSSLFHVCICPVGLSAVRSCICQWNVKPWLTGCSLEVNLIKKQPPFFQSIPADSLCSERYFLHPFHHVRHNALLLSLQKLSEEFFQLANLWLSKMMGNNIHIDLANQSLQ